MGVQSQPEKLQDTPIPFLGQSFCCLIGELEGQEDLHTYETIDLPETYDLLLRTLSYAAPI